MSRLVTLPVGQRSARRIVNAKVYKGVEAQAKRDEPCRSCKERLGAQLHHLVSRALGGDDVIENLVGLCLECHERLHRGLTSVRIYLAIGETLRTSEIEYIVGKKGAGWAESTYGVVA